MVKKKTKQKVKTHTRAHKKKKRAKTKVKETVRVKTFIVEKPVYVQAPSRFSRLKEKIPLYSGDNSRYAKQKEYEENYAQEDYQDVKNDEELNQPMDDLSDEPVDESFEEPVDGDAPQTEHMRSRGLFQNIWWKKGLLKGFFVWLLIVVFVYVLDFFGMAEVVDVKRWVFFLILLLILGMGYQKYLSGKIDF